MIALCADTELAFYLAKLVDATERSARETFCSAPELLFQDIIRSFASLWLPGTRARPVTVQAQLKLTPRRGIEEFGWVGILERSRASISSATDRHTAKARAEGVTRAALSGQAARSRALGLEIASPRVVVALASAASARTVPQTARDDHNARTSGCAGAGRSQSPRRVHTTNKQWE